MKLLVIHQNFPGQFCHVVLAALARRDQVVAIGRDTAPGVAGVKIYRYRAVGRAPKPSQNAPPADTPQVLP